MLGAMIRRLGLWTLVLAALGLLLYPGTLPGAAQAGSVFCAGHQRELYREARETVSRKRSPRGP